MLGTEQGTLGAWLRSNKRPSLRFILKIARLTDGDIAPADWLVGKLVKPARSKPAPTDAAAE